MRATLRALALGILVLGTASVGGNLLAERAAAAALPAVASRPPALFDVRPVEITVTALWQKAPRTVSVDQLLTDHTIWRQMHFSDWDKVPGPLRQRALGSMLDHYGAALVPRTWIALSVFDWDLVPQPIRALAYQRMIAHWTSFYDVGAGYADDPALVERTVSAIVMAESWFEHRAINVNEYGNRDLGLAGCSNHCRRVLGEMHGEGKIDFLLDDQEYFDPWNGTRVAAVWFGRELARAEGEMVLAIAAYHRGLKAAARGEGRDYAANVERLRRTYIEGTNAPPSWAYLLRRAAEIDSHRSAAAIQTGRAVTPDGATEGGIPGAGGSLPETLTGRHTLRSKGGR